MISGLSNCDLVNSDKSVSDTASSKCDIYDFSYADSAVPIAQITRSWYYIIRNQIYYRHSNENLISPILLVNLQIVLRRFFIISI
jgi:Tfp pilus assembly protein PilV